MKKYLYIGIATFVIVFIYFFNPLKFIDNLFYDLNFTFQSNTTVDSVVIVGIDRQSIRKNGALPWPRSIMAKLVKQIASAEPKVIALDFQFPYRNDQGESDSLAAILSTLHNVVLPFSVDGISTEPAPLGSFTPSPLLLNQSIHLSNNKDQVGQLFFYNAKQIDPPDSMFFNRIHYSGFLNMSTSNSSQKLREAIHVIRAGEYYFPSFAIATAAAFYDIPISEIILDGKGYLGIGAAKVPISSYAASQMLHFRSDNNPIKEYSASDILADSFERSQFKGKVVFVGVTDPLAAADFFTTPLRSQYPGVAVWATAVLDIIHKSWVRTDSAIPGTLYFLLTLLIFPGLALIIPSKQRHISLLSATILMLSGVINSVLLFKFANSFVSPMPPVYAWVFSLIWLAALRVDPTLAGSSSLQIEPPSDTDGDSLPPPSTVTPVSIEALQCETLDHIFLKANPLSTTDNNNSSSEPVFKTIDEKLTNLKKAITTSENIEKILECSGGHILSLLGSGGMADVYLLWHPRLETYRAIKVMKPHLSDNFRSRFETEIRIFSKLDHPNIVRCFGVGDWHSLSYIEMEYINGTSFENVLKKCSIISVDQAVITGILICRALEYAHSRSMHIYGKEIHGIIHRDLKPANVMITKNGRVKLTDFGIARPQELSLHTTESENIAGTLPYMAPEIFDRNEYMPRTDIYALGATLYECIAGERTFPQTTVTTILNAKTCGRYKPLSSIVKIPHEIETIIDTSLHVDPSKRYQSVKEMRLDLEKQFLVSGIKDGFGHIIALTKRIWGS
jgi:serine/threonine-protein kinase